MRRYALLAGLMVGLGLLLIQPVSAQTRSVFWQRWDVLINNIDTRNNRFDVTETYDVHFTGSFSFGSRVIEMRNLEDIQDVRVSQNGQPMRASCNEQPGTFCVRDTAEGRSIRYQFFQPINNASSLFDIQYTVVGALRVYEGGDQIWWTAIPAEKFGFSVGSSTVTVQLPPGFAPREGVDPADTYGAPGEVRVQGTTVQARAVSTISSGQAFEIRVQYPHDPQARKAGWQDNFDVRRAYEENIAPLVNLGLVGLSLLIAMGGPLAMVGVWYTRGRDPKIGPVPAYLSEKPSDLPPAVVGSLVDERVDVRDIISTLVDLAHRGYIVMEEERTAGVFGIGASKKFYFKRTDKPVTKELRSFERRIMNRLFPGNKMERSLDSLRNSFYKVIPQVQKDLYNEMVSEKLFTTNPDTTRNLWRGVGILLLVAAGIVFTFLMSAIEETTGALMCLPLAIGLTAVIAIIVGGHMPAKTRAGAEEAAKWNAFREYLRNLEQYGGLQEAAERFDEFLPYAVAFGIDRSWVRKFSQISDMPIPRWYYPTYMGGPYRGGYTPGTSLPSAGYGDLARASGGFSVNQMADSVAGSLQSVSDGLTDMLNSASRVMTSQPQSSSGGGGGWSGGGGGGGGSSGGGSSGFG